MALPSGRPGRLFPPLGIVVFLILLAGAAFFFPLPETGAVWVSIIFFTILIFLHPLNGVAFLMLIVPFFLGNPYKPYIALLEVFLYGTWLSLAVRRPGRGAGSTFPLKIPLALFLLSAVLSFPLDIRELLYTLWALPFQNAFYEWLSGNPGSPVHGLRVLANLLSACGLSVALFQTLQEETESFLTRMASALAVMMALISLAGLLLLWEWLPRGRTYASLSLVGLHEGAITAFAFNRQFLAQYLLLGLPLTVYLGLGALTERKVARLLLAVGALLLSTLALAASMQRSVYIVLALQVGFLSVVYGRWLRLRPRVLILACGSPLLIVAGLFLADWFFFNQNFLQRLQTLGQIRHIRPALWSTAWAMFTFSPALGIGLGRYYHFFPEFFPGLPGAWQQFNVNRGNAHSIYVQMLAEQGVLGLSLFAALVGLLLTLALKGLARETRPPRQALLLAVTTTVITWLVLGLFHHIAYDLRSLEIFFWIFCALLLALARNVALSLRPGTKTLLGLLVLLTAAGGYQVKLVGNYPLEKNFEAGFYRWEKAPDGSPLRWMGRRAVAFLEARPGTLLIAYRAPLPAIAQRPQEVRLVIEDQTYRASLVDDAWNQLRIPFSESRRRPAILRLETAYTVNPAKSGSSSDRRDLGLQLREFQWLTP
jgi:O-antigen ligase